MYILQQLNIVKIVDSVQKKNELVDKGFVVIQAPNESIFASAIKHLKRGGKNGNNNKSSKDVIGN